MKSYIVHTLLLLVIISVVCLSFTTRQGNDPLIKNLLAAIPDLKIAAVTISGAGPCGGAGNEVRVMVYNGGSGPTKGKVQVRLNIVPLDSVVVKSLSAFIYPNQFKTITFPNINLKRGDNRITAIANPNKTMPEKNYKNNTKTVSVKAAVSCD